jgi:glutamate 5-kinase
LEKLLNWNVLPIINENDVVSTDEIGIQTTIGENDSLSAIVARLVQADLLILLSDIDGLYTADPHRDPNAKRLTHVPALTEEIYALAGVSASAQGTGGMVTKLHAAKICLDSGCAMVIANGNTPENLYDILDGKPIGTLFGEVTL